MSNKTFLMMKDLWNSLYDTFQELIIPPYMFPVIHNVNKTSGSELVVSLLSICYNYVHIFNSRVRNILVWYTYYDFLCIDVVWRCQYYIKDSKLKDRQIHDLKYKLRLRILVRLVEFRLNFQKTRDGWIIAHLSTHIYHFIYMLKRITKLKRRQVSLYFIVNKGHVCLTYRRVNIKGVSKLF